MFKIIQELLAPSNNKQQKNQFNSLMAKLPDDHKAKWFAGAALNTSEQSMASVMSTALSRLNAFLDSELETILCNDTEIDAERFCAEKSAIFIIMPEEDSSKKKTEEVEDDDTIPSGSYLAEQSVSERNYAESKKAIHTEQNHRSSLGSTLISEKTE